jgi:hypothetical protein
MPRIEYAADLAAAEANRALTGKRSRKGDLFARLANGNAATAFNLTLNAATRLFTLLPFLPSV